MNIDNGLFHLSEVDPKMAKLINKYEKPNFIKETNHFEAIIRSIIYQQLSTKAASAIHNRFKQLFENDNLRPVDVFNNSIDRYREIGLSKQKVSYIINVAHEFNNELIPKNLEDFSDEDIIDMLTRIKGIGRWTAQMFLMFSLNRSDILPELDLGIQKGVKIYFKLNELPSGDYIIKQAELWRPYRTLASWYLWRLVEGPFEW
tara:strand:+ start:58 stop:666 length:609 start_codon:yes stop_codon:yes gene_type:complete